MSVYRQCNHLLNFILLYLPSMIDLRIPSRQPRLHKFAIAKPNALVLPLTNFFDERSYAINPARFGQRGLNSTVTPGPNLSAATEFGATMILRRISFALSMISMPPDFVAR